MRTYDHTWLMTSVAADLKRRAGYGTFDGLSGDDPYLLNCRAMHLPTNTLLTYTRDLGMHSCGWFKNPGFEFCRHLSISFYDPTALLKGLDVPAPRDKKLTAEWLGLFFGKDQDKLWCEPPSSAYGKSREVWHYRLFMAPDFITPIVPHGEVYSRELTEVGWKSFSEVQADLRQAEDERNDRSC